MTNSVHTTDDESRQDSFVLSVMFGSSVQCVRLACVDAALRCRSFPLLFYNLMLISFTSYGTVAFVTLVFTTRSRLLPGNSR